MTGLVGSENSRPLVSEANISISLNSPRSTALKSTRPTASGSPRSSLIITHKYWEAKLKDNGLNELLNSLI